MRDPAPPSLFSSLPTEAAYVVDRQISIRFAFYRSDVGWEEAVRKGVRWPGSVGVLRRNGKACGFQAAI